MAHRRGSVVERVKAQGREAEFKAKFKELDTTGSGQLDVEAMRAFMKRERPRMSDRQALLLFSRVDSDGSGHIEFDEFVEFVLALELMEAKRLKKKGRRLRQWDGPEQLKVNGSWDRETRLALQEFLAAQETPTANVVKPSQFVCGQMKASHVVVLQELLQICGVKAAVEGGTGSLPCGSWNARTTKALNQLLLAEGAPTALHIGKSFEDEGFSKNCVIALQEFLAMMRRGNGSALSLAR